MTRTVLARIRRMFWRVLLGLGAAAAVFLSFTSTGRYLVAGAVGEAKILARRQPIERLVGDTTVDAATRAKLRLVLDARTFAVEALDLRADKSFTTFTQLDSDTLVLVLTVAYRDSLAVKTWWWPIVGRVPYQGFFDLEAARRAQARHEREGFDTELRPAAAFSTLGWFNDPLLSTTLRSDSASLVNTVVHELAHNTLWVAGDVTFNESFASFVGQHGAMEFFRVRNDSGPIRRLQRSQRVSRTMGPFYAVLYAELDSAFAAHPGPANRERRIAVRDTIFARAHERLAAEVAPALGITDTTWATRVELNIASLLARRVYRDNVVDFERVLDQSGGDLRNAIARISAAVRSAPKGEALAAVRALAK